MSQPLLEAIITCPVCRVASHTRMPEAACQYFWECPACGAVLKPQPGDCCVFCSYADVACPVVQARANHSCGE
jgi:hypothetical protein